VGGGVNSGIGTTTPREALEVGGSLGLDGALAIDQNALNTSGGLTNAVLFGATPAVASEGIASRRGPGWCDLEFYTAGKNRLTVGNGGFVGIGTNAPAWPLHVVAPDQPYMIIDNQSATSSKACVGLGSYSAGRRWEVGCDISANNTDGFYIWQQTASAVRLFIDTSGHVGIGTTTPRGMLEVNGSGWINAGSYAYLNYQGFGFSGGTDPFGIKAGAWILCGECDAFSDARIKVVEGRTDTRAALASVNRLQLTDYTYIDTIEHGSQRHVGVIAQEAAAVAPDVVSQTTGFIPSIFAQAESTCYDAAARQLTVTLPKPHALTTGDVVRFAGAKETFAKTVVTAPDANTFVVGDIPAAEPQVFVIGKQVNDFHSVNYQDLFANGLAAIQELSKKNLELRRQKAALFQRLEALEAKAGN
jgi:hypothetical protein